MEPKALHFVWNQTHMEFIVLNNLTKDRLAIKVKCSDNKIYRVKPVFIFCEPEKSVKFLVNRDNSAAVKIDKLVLVVMNVSYFKFS